MVVALVPFVLQSSNLTGAYTGIPALADANGLAVAMQTHGVTVRLGHGTVSSSSVTVVRNSSAKAGTIAIQIPNHVRQAGTMGALQGVDPSSVSWDGKVLNPNADLWTNEINVNALISKDGGYTIKVPVKAKGTHSLKIAWQYDILTSGMRGSVDNLVYDVSGASTWPGGIGQFRYSIQYVYGPMPGAKGKTSPVSPVFAVEKTIPASGWQVGANGAFFGANNYRPGNGVLNFAFHPNGF